MEQKFHFIAYVRNSEYPLSDCFKMVINIAGINAARKFFLLNGTYVCPDDLAPFITLRQLSRFKTFYNKPRHYDLFFLDVRSCKSASL